jgi:hypothetical protein
MASETNANKESWNTQMSMMRLSFPPPLCTMKALGIQVTLADYCILFAISAVAQTKESAHEHEYQKAEQAYQDMEYTLANTILLGIIATPTATPEERVKTHLLNGTILRIMGNDVEARLSFVYILRKNPEAQLPAETAPKVRNFFELVRQEILATGAAAGGSISQRPPNTGSLVFGSSPSDLDVQINDGDVMRSPFFQNLAPGKYKVRIKVPGELPIEFVTTVRKGVTHKIKVELWRNRDHTEQEISTRELNTSIFYCTSFFKCCTGGSIGPTCCGIAACFSPGLIILQLIAGDQNGNPLGFGPDNYLDLGILVFNVVANGCVGTTGLGLLGWGVYDVVVGPPELEPAFHHIVVQTSSDGDDAESVETFPSLFPPQQQNMEY